MKKKSHRQLIRVKTKYQVTLPPNVREQFHLGVGDLLEVSHIGTSIILTPKTIVDKHLAGALQDVAEGKIKGPFASPQDLLRNLKK